MLIKRQAEFNTIPWKRNAIRRLRAKHNRFAKINVNYWRKQLELFVFLRLQACCLFFADYWKFKQISFGRKWTRRTMLVEPFIVEHTKIVADFNATTDGCDKKKMYTMFKIYLNDPYDCLMHSNFSCAISTIHIIVVCKTLTTFQIIRYYSLTLVSIQTEKL